MMEGEPTSIGTDFTRLWANLSFGDPTVSAELARECPEGDLLTSPLFLGVLSLAEVGLCGVIGDPPAEADDLQETLGDCGYIKRRRVSVSRYR